MIQTALTSLLLLAIGYLLGAIPSGYLAGRWLKGIDLRECGSGSTGAQRAAHRGQRPSAGGVPD